MARHVNGALNMSPVKSPVKIQIIFDQIHVRVDEALQVGNNRPILIHFEGLTNIDICLAFYFIILLIVEHITTAVSGQNKFKSSLSVWSENSFRIKWNHKQKTIWTHFVTTFA